MQDPAQADNSKTAHPTSTGGGNSMGESRLSQATAPACQPLTEQLWKDLQPWATGADIYQQEDDARPGSGGLRDRL